jgi:small subunit ribosomal protein S7e
MSAANKVLNTEPSELELQIGQAFIDLENASAELKAELRPLQFKAAREYDVQGGKKAIVIFVPVPLLQAFHNVQQRLTRELEKKFSDRHVLFLAERRILPKPGRKRSKQNQKRPRSRTLTAVHDAMLEDLVFPTEIVGKRIRYQVGGGKLYKILLDSKDIDTLDYKLESFQSVYNKLTGKQVVFQVPSAQGEVY